MALCKALQQSEGEFKLFQLVCDCVLLAAQCAIQFSSEPNLLLLVAALFVEFIQYSFLNRSRHVMVVTSVLSLYTIYTQKTLHYDLSLVLKVQSFFVILQFPRDTSSQRSQQRHLNQALYVLQTYFRISLQPIFWLQQLSYKLFHMFHSLISCNQPFSADTKIFSYKILKNIFAHKKLKKPPQKVAYLWQLEAFFSLEPRLPKTAQNFISVL